jgi:spore maturation protein CgeB
VTPLEETLYRGAFVLVGNPGPEHVGRHFHDAAGDLGIECGFLDLRRAHASVLQKVSWHLRGHRPGRLRSFSREVVAACRDVRAGCLLVTGIAPPSAAALREIASLGTVRMNFLTDDPWNPAHRAAWFLQALANYDHVFSPRAANIEDLRALGGPGVSYLPFAYAAAHHVPPSNAGPGGHGSTCDVVFVGGADRDRVGWVGALLRAGIGVECYGGYWDRFPETRGCARGMAAPDRLAEVLRRGKVVLCLVRRANRDGHSMRTFESAAMGACMLVEDTEDHRRLFGPDGEAVRYFRSREELVDRAGWLVRNDAERARLAAAAQAIVVGGSHRYRDRLTSMLDAVARDAPAFPLDRQLGRLQ